MKKHILFFSVLNILSIAFATSVFAADSDTDNGLGQSDWQTPSSTSPQQPAQLGQSNWQMPSSISPQQPAQLGQSNWQMPSSTSPQQPAQLGQSNWQTPAYQGQVQSNWVQPQAGSNQFGQYNPAQPGASYPPANIPQSTYPNYQQTPFQQSTASQSPSNNAGLGDIINALGSAASIPLAAAMAAKMARGYGLPFGGYNGGYGLPAYPAYNPYYPAYPSYPGYYGYGNNTGITNNMLGRFMNQALMQLH